MIAQLILLPALAGILSLLLRHNGLRRTLLVLVAMAHTGLTASAWVHRPAPMAGGWLALDTLGLYFLSLTSTLFLAASFYAVGYLAKGGHNDNAEGLDEGLFFTNAPEAVFSACLLFFLATMTFVCSSMHFGLMWVAVEATTLVSAPLIYFHRHSRSLEATWKYLLLCSVGIALALLGNFFLAVAGFTPGHESESGLLVESLVRNAKALHAPWLKAAFIFFLVGYGTKMGLAPLHTWLPDAHSESPSVVSALLSGALLNCAFLGILRAFRVCAAAGLAPFAQQLLIVFGILSMIFAAIFIIGQSDFKRMLAYSSVEHMGILALGIGIGGAGIFGSMLHALNHSLTKAVLFLTAGNILAAYRTKSVASVRGVVRVLPVSGVLWIIGFLAICGSPPFGAFLSEFTILKAALDAHHWWLAGAYLLLLGVIFVGMSSAVLAMAQGQPLAPSRISTQRESWLSVAPPIALAAAALVLGLYVPPALNSVLHEVSRLLGAGGVL